MISKTTLVSVLIVLCGIAALTTAKPPKSSGPHHSKSHAARHVPPAFRAPQLDNAAADAMAAAPDAAAASAAAPVEAELQTRDLSGIVSGMSDFVSDLLQQIFGTFDNVVKSGGQIRDGDRLGVFSAAVQDSGKASDFLSGLSQVSEALGDTRFAALLERVVNFSSAVGGQTKRDISNPTFPGFVGSLTDPLGDLRDAWLGQENTKPTLQWRDLARAPVLECIASSNTVTEPDDDGNCEADEIPKRPGSYVWSLASWGKNVFIGEKTDVLCEWGTGFGSSNSQARCPATKIDRLYMMTMNDDCAGEPTLKDITPKALFNADNDDDDVGDDDDDVLTEMRGIACVDLRDRLDSSSSESSSSVLSSSTSTGAVDIDFENTVSGSSSSVSEDPTSSSSSRIKNWADGEYEFCVGLASAYSPQDRQDVRLFVFNAKTGENVATGGTHDVKGGRAVYAHNGRIFVTAQLYENGEGGILEWRPTRDDPLKFVVVADFADVAGSGAEIVFHHGRLFATTWPTLFGSKLEQYLGAFNFAAVAELVRKAQGMKLMMSPLFDEISVDTAQDWTVVFDVCEHDPNPVTCRISGGGAVVEHNDELIFGTMNLIVGDLLMGVFACLAINSFGADVTSGSTLGACDGGWATSPYDACDYCSNLLAGVNPANPLGSLGSVGLDQIIALVASVRATSIYRGRHLGEGDPSRWRIQVLYGNSFTIFPDYQLVPYLSDVVGAPQFGHAGFGNRFNSYSWAGASYNGRVYWGTYDSLNAWDLLLQPLVFSLVPDYINLELGTFGADMYHFQSTRQSAAAETLDGFSEAGTYGIRQLKTYQCPATGREVLLAGTANPYSLFADGGWRVKLLEPIA